MSHVDPLEDTATEGPFGPGSRVGMYVIERRLGEGGMGVVYAARHDALDKPVVIKVLSPLLAAHSESVSRFLREGRAASRIRHPHVVDVTDVGTHEGVPYMVMERLEGEDLSTRLKRVGRLAETEAVKIMLPVLDAVATAHELGVLHRDLKPSNIFLATGPGGREIPMVLDFGLAKIFEGQQRNDDLSLTRSASFLGTPFYVSPEQAQMSSMADVRSDQYSLGAILYELVSGLRTVEGGNPFEVISAIIAGRIIPLQKALPGAPSELVRIVERAMAHRPEDRFASVRELGGALLQRADRATRGVWEPTFGTAGGASKAVPPPKSSSRGIWIGLALGITALIAGGVPLAWWWVSANEPSATIETTQAPPPPVETPAPAQVAPQVPPPTLPPPEEPSFGLEVAPAAPAAPVVEPPPPVAPPRERIARPYVRPSPIAAPQPSAFSPSRPIAPVSAPSLQRGTNNAPIVR